MDDIDRMVARIERIDATFVSWSERMAARAVLMRDDPEAYAAVAVLYAAEEAP
jgi:hypothetical protein